MAHMEITAPIKCFQNIYEGKTILITGHTGFKGSWLAYWLSRMGAHVIGYALSPPSTPSHFQLLKPILNITSIIGDIRDRTHLQNVLTKYRPDIIFHLAAQPLVRYSYHHPYETYETNVLGTLNLIELCRTFPPKAFVNITSDKVYENQNWLWGYRENDPLGGHDPYSASKACADILTQSYTRSFFAPEQYGNTHHTLIATCRAGNVIGGGDWGKDRLFPDIMKSTMKQKSVIIRKPHATRPWQHVLEPLSGYLLIGQKLLEGQASFAQTWNFGPDSGGQIDVETIIGKAQRHWNAITYNTDTSQATHYEADLLKLDCSKAYTLLHWHGVWDTNKAVKYTVEWYKAYYEHNRILTTNHLHVYLQDAQKKGLVWAN